MGVIWTKFLVWSLITFFVDFAEIPLFSSWVYIYAWLFKAGNPGVSGFSVRALQRSRILKYKQKIAIISQNFHLTILSQIDNYCYKVTKFGINSSIFSKVRLKTCLSEFHAIYLTSENRPLGIVFNFVHCLNRFKIDPKRVKNRFLYLIQFSLI